MAVPGAAADGPVAQQPNRVALGIEPLRGRRCPGGMEEVAVFGGEQKDRAINELQELAEELREGKGPGLQALAQGAVPRMREEAVSEHEECLLHTFA